MVKTDQDPIVNYLKLHTGAVVEIRKAPGKQREKSPPKATIVYAAPAETQAAEPSADAAAPATSAARAAIATSAASAAIATSATIGCRR